MAQLHQFVESNDYLLPSYALDLLTKSLANTSVSKIIVHYIKDGSIRQHVFKPDDLVPCGTIEIIHLINHYDLVVSQDTEVKLEDIKLELPFAHSESHVREIISISIDDSQESNLSESSGNVPISDCEEKPLFTTIPVPGKIVVSSDDTGNEEENIDMNVDIIPIPDLDEQMNESVGNIIYRGSKRYIVSNAPGREDFIPVQVVPDDIDGKKFYQVPLVHNLQNCRGLRPWAKATSSKVKGWTKGPRLLFNCRGTYACTNLQCKNIFDFGVNRTDFRIDESVTYCNVCSAEAILISCPARLIIEQDIGEKHGYVSHWGRHTCTLKVSGRPTNARIAQLLAENPNLSREMLIRQEIEKHIEKTDLTEALGTAAQLTDTKFIENKKAQEKNQEDQMVKVLKL